MRRIFCETLIFTEKLDNIGDSNLLRSIEEMILENPEAGSTVAGTGGIRN